MYPDQTLHNALDALTRSPLTPADLDDARQALAALADWIDGGGYLPRWPIAGPSIVETVAALADHPALVVQATRVAWMLDAIDGSPEAARRVLLAVNALRYQCASTAITMTEVDSMREERGAR
jgi:hypothetical protein